MAVLKAHNSILKANHKILAKLNKPEPGYKGLLCLFYGDKVFPNTNYKCCNYLADEAYQTETKTLSVWSFIPQSGPLNTMVISCPFESSWNDTFSMNAKNIITGDWTFECYYKASTDSSRTRFTFTEFPGWPYETVFNSYNEVKLFGVKVSLNGKLNYREWNHIAFEYEKEANLVHLYINGVLTLSLTPVAPTTNGPQIKVPSGDFYYSEVSIQQMALWNKRISNGQRSFTPPGLYMDKNGNWLF